jgi:hypothetical protein
LPRYHLHIHCDGEVVTDDEGGEFPDEDAAVKEAVRSIRSLVCGDVVSGALHLDLSIEIRDDRDTRLQEVVFEDAITIRGGRAGRY